MTDTAKKFALAASAGPTVRTHVALPRMVLAAIDAMAESEGVRRSDVLAELLSEKLSEPRRKPRPPRCKTFERLPRPAQDVAKKRKAIVEGWRAARRAARLAHRPIDGATAAYLRTVASTHGIKVCRATLYLWDQRFRARQLLGLADARGLERPRSARRPGAAGEAFEPASKVV